MQRVLWPFIIIHQVILHHHEQDIQLTNRLYEAGELLVRIINHYWRWVHPAKQVY